jgi:Putative Ig domain
MAVSKFTNSSSANDFNLNIGSTYSVVTLTQEYPAGAYSFTSVANDTTMDLYFYNAQGYVCYTNTKGVIAPNGFNKVVVIGGTVGDVLSFSYKTTFTTVAETSEVTAGPVVLSVTPTSLPNVNSSTTVTGLNFATDVTATFTGTDSLVRNAKSVVRGSATSLVVTRPDSLPISSSPYTLTITNPSVTYQPTGTNSHLISVTAGVGPVWQTPAGALTGGTTNVAYSYTLSATDADGGSSVTYALSSGTVPAGTTLNTTTGVLSGTATSYSASTFTVRATDSGGNFADRTFSLSLNSPFGLGADNPASSIAALRSAGITTNGAYWLSTAKQAQPFQAYCRFNYIDGGDWYLLLKLFNRADMPSGSPYWVNTTTINNSDFNLSNTSWSKYDAWNGIAFTKLMMDMGGKIPPIMNFSQSKTMAEAITASGATLTGNGPGYIASSTDPSLSGSGINYSSMSMKSGTNFSRQSGGAEPYLAGYGIGIFPGAAGHAIAGTSDSSFGSLPTAYNNGAWIGAALDDATSNTAFVLNSGADSGLGIGFNTGNVNRTSSSGYAEWGSGVITDLLPAYVWVR